MSLHISRMRRNVNRNVFNDRKNVSATTPLFSVRGHPLRLSPGVTHLFCFPFSLRQVFRGLPLRLFPGRGGGVPCDGLTGDGFLRFPECVHLHFLFFISFSMSSCLVHFQSVMLDTLSVHLRCKILQRLSLMKFCILLVSCFAPQIVINIMNTTLAFSILALTSSPLPPFLLIVLPRYVNSVSVFLSSSGSPFIVMGLLFFLLAFITFVLLLLMLSPSCVDTVVSSSVFSCIC